MKTRNITRRAVSVLFCLLLLCTLVPLVYASGGDSVIAGAEMKVGSDRVQVIYNAAVDVIWQKIEQWKSDPGQYKGHGIRLD